jgi:Flp pilus assembly protein TadG
MIWNKSFILSILAAVICELSIAMHASRALASAMKQTDRQAIGTECKGCSKMFASMYAAHSMPMINAGALCTRNGALCNAA